MSNRFDLTAIPTGWVPRSWIWNLERIATGCEQPHRERANELSKAAAAILERIGFVRLCQRCEVELEDADPGQTIRTDDEPAIICRVCDFRRILEVIRQRAGAA